MEVPFRRGGDNIPTATIEIFTYYTGFIVRFQ
jgi:hypothetical protein